MSRKLFYASDYRGINLRKALVAKANFNGFDVADIGIEDGSSLDYVDISKALADNLKNFPDSLGIIACGSGQGVAMALNRFTHIRAAVCRTPEDAVQIREKLNANVICLGSKNSSEEEAQKLIEAFISADFLGDKHTHCVQKLAANQTAHTNNGVNIIVRAIIMHEGHILLTTTTPENKNFPTGLFFLPGGHVEYNEPAASALKREIWEEMHLEISSASFAGALECSWNRKGLIYHELNLVYVVNIENLSLITPPLPMDHNFHMFVWKRLDEIKSLSILPEALKEIILSNAKSGDIKFLSSMMEDLN